MFKDIINSIEGDAIYAFKPKIISYGAGLLAKLIKRISLILDIEDLETVNYIEKSMFLNIAGIAWGRNYTLSSIDI